MSNFVVSARKYRPDRFGEVVGQDHVTNTLRNALIQDQLAHAILFCGPRGVGKTTCARILAKILNCSNPSEAFDPCDECESCQAFNEQTSFNIIELDAASNNSVEHIRSLVEQVRFPPQRGDYKVFIIDEVHMLSTSAFNAFLKTLEEPPPYAIFILATTEKHKIIPTILSRCQIYDFKRIGISDIVSRLEEICQKEEIEADREALHVIAQKADGALRDALSILDRMISTAGEHISYEDVIEHLNVLDYDYYFRATEAITAQRLDDVFTLFDEVVRNGFDGDLFIIGLAQHFRDLLMCKDPKTVNLLEVSDSLRERYVKQSGGVSTRFLLSALEIANQCDIHYKQARNKRLHVEMALSKMAYLTRLISGENMFYPDDDHEGSVSDQKQVETNSGGTNPEKAGEEEVGKAGDQGDKEAQTEEEESSGTEAAKTEGIPVDEEKDGTNDSEQVVEDSGTEGGRTAAARDEEKSSAAEEEDVVEQQSSDSEEEPSTEPSSANGGKKKIRKVKKRSTPSLGDIGQMAEEVETESESDDDGQKELDLDALTDWWDEQTERQSLPTLKSEMGRAELKIKGDALCIEVNSRVGKGRLQQERDLIHRLREVAGKPALTILFEVHREEQEQEERTKPLSFKEKYEHMKSKNPLLDELRDRFDLKIDRSV